MAKSESTKIEFGYFHDYESEQFAFYRIPKVLFTDEYFRNLSSDAKVLYGLMLDRMALSIRHQWFDEEGKRWIKKKHPTFDGDVYVENIRCFLDISKEELEKRKCTVNEQDTTALIFSQKHLEALYLQCLMHRRNAMQEVPELKGLSETCNRIYKLQDVDVLFQCLLMDQMYWEEKLYVQFSTVYILKK